MHTHSFTHASAFRAKPSLIWAHPPPRPLSLLLCHASGSARVNGRKADPKFIRGERGSKSVFFSGPVVKERKRLKHNKKVLAHRKQK